MTKEGIELITDERARQISEEGWTAEHDNDYDLEQLALAAVCYALPPDERGDNGWGRPKWWPWHGKWWKPNPINLEGRVRELAKAGALIAAEIDRLQRTYRNSNS